MNALRIPVNFDRFPLTYRARVIARQIDPKYAAWRRIQALLIELADELDLASRATPQVWPPRENA